MISVCAPYFNRQSALTRMLAQYSGPYSDLDLEISICDDGSTPPAAAPPSVVMTRLPKKRQPLNPCVPINRAVEASSGEIVVLTNPETVHEGPVLYELLELLEDEDDYAVAPCYGVGYRVPRVWLAGPDADYSLYGRLPVPPGGHFHFLAAMHRSLWDRAGGFDEDYRHVSGCDDNDWLWRLHRAGARFQVSEGCVWQPKGGGWPGLPHGRELFRQKWPDVA